MKRIIRTGISLCIAGCLLIGCGAEMQNSTQNDTTQTVSTDGTLADGIYSAAFNTDSSMFGLNETCEGRATLTADQGKMWIHLTLKSKNIVNLFVGTAEDAQKPDAEILQPTTDSVTYSDGYTEEVYGFNVPISVLEQEFSLAILGKKGTWYDHKVSVSDVQPVSVEEEETAMDTPTGATVKAPEDGDYMMPITLQGGTGRAELASPARVTVKDGMGRAELIWSSPNYDYMIVDGEKYLPINTAGNAVFEIPISVWNQAITIIADTTAMSTPHEIEYRLTVDALKAESIS